MEEEYICFDRGFCTHAPLRQMEIERIKYVVRDEQEVIASHVQVPVCERLSSLDQALFDQVDHCSNDNFNEFQSPSGARGETG